MCAHDMSGPEVRQSTDGRPLVSLHGAAGFRDVSPLLAPLHRQLVALLRALAPEQWERPTVAGAWRVRDVVAHLLDGDLRRISAHRDGHQPGGPLSTYEEVLARINAQNATAVEWGRRLSPRVLTDLVDVAGLWAAEFVAGVDPHAPALWGVAWAGEEESEHWMDVGREYTERWHHQMQIRDAVGAPPLLLERAWLLPLLDFSVRALPRAYAALEAPAGTAIALRIGEDSWSLVRDDSAEWELFSGAAADAQATLRIAPDAAWRLWFNAFHALPAEEARAAVVIEGDAALAMPLFGARAVMV